MIGVARHKSDALIDWVSPVNWLAPLNRGLLGWWLCVPGAMGGRVFPDLTRTNPQAVLTNMDPQSDWLSASFRPGGFGCLDLDGTNDYCVTTSTFWTWAGSSTLTVALWINPTAFQASSPFISHLFNWGSDGSTETVFFRLGDSALAKEKLQFGIDISSQQKLNGVQSLTTGTWFHCVAIYDGVNQYIYVNGAQDASQAKTGVIDTPPTNRFLDFGRSSPSAGRYYNGKMDDLRLYNRALSAEEVKHLYHASRTGYQAELRRMRRAGSWQAAAASGVGPLVGPGRIMGGHLNRGRLIRA